MEKEIYLYPYSAAEARTRNELALWRVSYQANEECARDIEEHIRTHFDGAHLNDSMLQPLLDKWGYSPEVTQTRLDAWMQGSKMIAQKWISEKRYRELISCVHRGWYQDDVLFEPLAIHFVKNHLFDELRFLCEHDIRHSVKNLLLTIKSEKEEHKTLDITAVQCINVEVYVAGRGYSKLGEIAKYRKKSLDQIIRYIGYLEQIQAPVEYFEMVRDLQKKVVDLSVKPKDLKQICFRLSTEL